MKRVLEVVNAEMERLDIDYVYDNWDSDLVMPYCVGELNEIETFDEDNKREFTLMLSCEDNTNSYSRLFDISNTLKNTYKHNQKILFDNSVFVIKYSNTIKIPTEDENIKRIQINLNIKVWED